MATRNQDFVFVDVSPKPARAKVVREGYQVPPARVDANKIGVFIGDLVPTPPSQAPRVIGQSIAPGTRVTPGTVVDLMLAPKSSIPFDIFEELHADLAGKPITQIDPVFNNAAARKTLLTYEAAAEVPAAERSGLSMLLAQSGVQINEADGNRTFEKAFNSARNALAFR